MERKMPVKSSPESLDCYPRRAIVLRASYWSTVMVTSHALVRDLANSKLFGYKQLRQFGQA
jgi:hypothetical protein